MDNMDTSTQPEVDVTQTTQPEVEPTGVEPTESTPTLTVKYNKQEQELSMDEAREYAEKGMNYDKLKGQLTDYQSKNEELAKQLDGLKGSKWNKFGEHVEKNYGTTRDQFAEIQIDKARAKQEGITQEQAKALRIAEEKSANADIKLAKAETKLKELSDKEQREEYVRSQVDELSKAYPDVDPSNLPEEVRNDFNAGVPLKRAYDQYKRLNDYQKEISKLKEQIEVTAVNNENAAASTGAPGTTGQPDMVITRKSIKDMTPEQQTKHHDEIWKVLTSDEE